VSRGRQARRREAAAATPHPRNGANAHRMHSSVVSRVFTAQVFELCWVRTRAAQEPGSRRTAGCGRRAAAEHRRPPSRKTGQPARHYAHTGPHIPTSSSSPTQAPSFQWPSLVIFQGVQQPRQDAGRARAPSQFRQESTHTHTTPGLAQPAALWSQGWAAVQASTHARLPSPPRQAIAQSLVANAQLSATGSSTNLLHFACAGPRARGMHCFTQAKAYQ
jgi:hypothetical protein